MQLVDHTDDWDRVLNFEGEAFNDGVNEGRYAAVECKEMLENGIHSGFMKGIFQVSNISDHSLKTSLDSIFDQCLTEMPSVNIFKQDYDFLFLSKDSLTDLN